MMRTIRLGLISEGTNTWPLYVAQDAGFFEQEGISVEVTVTDSSIEQQQALIAGRFDIGFQQPDHVLRAVERGADLFVFMAHSHAPDLTLVGAPDIRDLKDLGGRTVAVDGARTGYALLLRRLLARSGVDLAGVTFEEIGGSEQRYQAMKSGAVAATLLNPPFDESLLKDGYSRLARLTDAFPTYPGSVMAARRQWVAAHEEAVLAFIRAYESAYGWLQDAANHAAATALLPDRLAIAPRAAAGALSEYAERPKPHIGSEGMQQVVDIVWAAEGYAQPKAAPEKYMDLSYISRALARWSTADPA
jgi:ABC-type nitrate/sulfonate/bicarbonate transport system substrate-binding protein